jgi:GNAT superfamily N-acetyltransferase
MEIRKLAEHDESMLTRAVQLLSDGSPPAPEMFLDDRHAHAFVALDGERVVGCAYGFELFRPEGRWVLVLCRIGIDEPGRRAGVGRDLLDTFVTFAQAKGHRSMRLFTDAGPEAARRLYDGAGLDLVSGSEGYWWVFE